MQRRVFGDPDRLKRLTAEVTAVDSKAGGTQRDWGYPDYLFGREPGASATRPGKKKKGSR
jgi:hypothetical protein